MAGSSFLASGVTAAPATAGPASLRWAVIVGGGESAARQLVEWADETDVDGFNLAYHITPGTFEDIVEFVVPELQKLGRYKTAYTDGTLRHKLFGRGDHLPQNHHGASFALRRRG